MEPKTKTGTDAKAFWLGVFTGLASAIAVGIIASRNDRIVCFDGEPHLIIRPLTSDGNELLESLVQTVNQKSSQTVAVSFID